MHVPQAPIAVYPCPPNTIRAIRPLLGPSVFMEKGICFSNLAKSFVAINQKAISRCSHEIRITMDIVTIIHPRHHFFKKALNLLSRTLRLELCDPNRSAVREFTGRSDMRLERLNGRSGIPSE